MLNILGEKQKRVLETIMAAILHGKKREIVIKK